MKQARVKFLNFALFLTITLYILLFNIRFFPQAVEISDNMSVIAIIGGVFIGIIGLIAIYNALYTQKPTIYYILIFYSLLSLSNFILTLDARTTFDYVLNIGLALPTLLCALLMLRWLKQIKQKAK